MKKLILLLILASTLEAQIFSPRATGVFTTAALPGTCSTGSLKVLTTDNSLYVCGPDNTWSKITAGANVVGAASSTDKAIVRFSGTTGKVIQNSVVTISDTGVMAGALFDLGANTFTATSAQVKAGVSDETGSGGPLVFATAPAVTGLTTDTLQTSGNVGIGTTPSVTAGRWLNVLDSGNNSAIIDIRNSNAAGTSAAGLVRAEGDANYAQIVGYGAAFNTAILGVTAGGWSGLISPAGSGLLVGTTISAPMRLGTNNTVAIVLDGTTAAPSLPLQALTAGTLTVTNSASLVKTVTRYDWTNAMVTALGGVGTGDITVCTLPAKTIVTNAYVVIDTPDSSANALTIALGRVSATYIDYIVASDAKASVNTVYGDASAERGTNLTGYDLPSITGTTAVKIHLIKTTTNLSTVTGSTGHIYLETAILP